VGKVLKKVRAMNMDLGGLAKFYLFTQQFLDRQGKIYVEVVEDELFQNLFDTTGHNGKLRDEMSGE